MIQASLLSRDNWPRACFVAFVNDVDGRYDAIGNLFSIEAARVIAGAFPNGGEVRVTDGFRAKDFVFKAFTPLSSVTYAFQVRAEGGGAVDDYEGAPR